MRHCIVFLAILVVAQALDLTYTQISFTISGKPCLNDCKNNKCFTDYQLTVNNCIPGNETAPVYHTSLTQYKPTCLSRCGKFGYNYDWCFVSNEQHWDYCSSETRTSWRKTQQTLHYGPCSDECKLNEYYNDHMCTNYHGSKYKCNPKANNHVQAKTIYGKKCVNKCDNNNGYGHYWCYDEEQNQVKCAPPAKPPALREFVNVPITKRIDCINLSKREKRCNTIVDHRGNISASAQKLEQQDYFQTESLNEHRNPVYKYTIQAPQNNENPWLPLVVRANITSDTVRCDDNNKPQAKTGLLIGHRIGGVIKPYNVVLLSATADGYLRKHENDIYQWVLKEGSVQITIVIMYEDTLSPFAFGLNYIFVKDGKVCKEIVDEIVYNNLPPGTESLGAEMTRVVPTTTVKPIELEDVIGYF